MVSGDQYVSEFLSGRNATDFAMNRSCPWCHSIWRLICIFLEQKSAESNKPSVIVSNMFISAWATRRLDQEPLLLTLSISLNAFGIGRIYLHRSDSDARALQGTVHIEKVKSWLHSCENGCPGHSNIDVPTMADTTSITLIDVIDGRLVPASTAARYVALSYVWGNVETLKTYSTNFKQLSQNGGISTQDARIPRSIQDAIVFTKAIGEHFLWVDSLCIIQDDEEQKHSQIQAMNLIYHNAVLTLIAATGSNANAGLAGVREQSRVKHDLPVEATLDEAGYVEGTLMIRSEGLHDILKASAYQNRGWTYQEQLLSRRCLFFTDWQVFFCCKHKLYREDGERIGDNLELTSINPLLWMSAGPSSEIRRREAFQAYMRLVENYSRRELTFPSDVLKAFSGLASELQRYASSGLVNGLLMHRFHQTLLWAPDAQIKSLRRRTECFKTAFPSWSWVGWKGPVSIPGEAGPLRVLIANISIGYSEQLVKYILPESRTFMPAFLTAGWTESENEANFIDVLHTTSSIAPGPNVLIFHADKLAAELILYPSYLNPGNSRVLMISATTNRFSRMSQAYNKGAGQRAQGILIFHNSEECLARAKSNYWRAPTDLPPWADNAVLDASSAQLLYHRARPPVAELQTPGRQGDFVVALSESSFRLYASELYDDFWSDDYVNVMLIKVTDDVVERIAIGQVSGRLWRSRVERLNSGTYGDPVRTESKIVLV